MGKIHVAELRVPTPARRLETAEQRTGDRSLVSRRVGIPVLADDFHVPRLVRDHEGPAFKRLDKIMCLERVEASHDHFELIVGQRLSAQVDQQMLTKLLRMSRALEAICGRMFLLILFDSSTKGKRKRRYLASRWRWQRQ